jgi:hypothetical protein
MRVAGKCGAIFELVGIVVSGQKEIGRSAAMMKLYDTEKTMNLFSKLTLL